MGCDALYIHLPFCEQKCPYCDFYSVPAREEVMDAYLAALLRALSRPPAPVGPLDTVYFGGGTPSLFGPRRFLRLMEEIRKRFHILPGAEVTAECNPHSSLPAALAGMREAGINRLSFGLQCADDRQLETLGRLHTVTQAEEAVRAASSLGFTHLSLDLMLATPGQTAGDIDRAVKLIQELRAEHVSAYLLKIEPGTPFDRRHMAAQCPDEEEAAHLYRHAVFALEKAGFCQYEISNFARAGAVARHNLKYWDCAQYLGVGPSAHSFLGGRRFYFPRDLAAFCGAENPFSLRVDDGPGGEMEEYLMLRLRLTEGVDWHALQARYPGCDPGPLKKRAAPLEKGGFLKADQRGIRLTLAGFLVSNAVIGALLDE